MRRTALVLSVFAALSCIAAGLPTQPNDREWGPLSNDYAWIESLRKAQAPIPPSATRKQQMEAMLANLQKLEPTYTNFVTRLDEYYLRTGDPRAAQVLAREKIILGDQYLALSRYDKAIDLYKEALVFQPDSTDAQKRITDAEQRRFVSMDAFARVKAGMKEEQTRALIGYPKEDWIKQVVQNGRVYVVWIFPKADGGAAAVYFDNGVVYHTNWNAASPQQSAAQAPAQ